MEIQRNQEFKVERLAKDEAIQEVLGLASASGCIYSFHLLCFLSLLQLPCFRWKTSQLRPDLLLPEKGVRRITGQSGVERFTLCKRFQRLRPRVSRYGCSADCGSVFLQLSEVTCKVVIRPKQHGDPKKSRV